MSEEMQPEMQPKEFIEVLREYIDTNIELTKFSIIERGSIIGSSIISGIVISIFGLLFLMLMSMGGGFLLGDLFDDNFIGFAIIAGMYLVLALLLYVFRKQIVRKTLRDKIVHALLIED